MNLQATTWSATILVIVVICHQSTSSVIPAVKGSKGKEAEYGVVIDAGSSGTRLEVYKYVPGQHSPIVPSDVQQVPAPPPSKLKPGISTLADSVSKVEKYLMVLIENAKKVVPTDKQAVTPTMLFATAGMRLLSKVKQDAILKEVDRIFSDKNLCPFLYKRGNARVITGEEEAVFGWITVNFLQGSFSYKDNNHTVGALDLGGGSTQNTFRVSHSGAGVPTLTVNLAGKTYPLYAHSYLGYGLTEATNTYMASLVNSNSKALKSPCHNKNFTSNIKIQNVEYKIQGKYNECKCRKLIKDKFFCNTNAKQCPMRNQPRLDGKFYAMNAYYYVIKDVGAISTHGQLVSLPQYESLTRKLCKKPASLLDPNLYDVYNLCFRLNYVFELLKDGYHIDFNTFVLQVGKKVKHYDLNWTLGALLYKTKIL